MSRNTIEENLNKTNVFKNLTIQIEDIFEFIKNCKFIIQNQSKNV